MYQNILKWLGLRSQEVRQQIVISVILAGLFSGLLGWYVSARQARDERSREANVSIDRAQRHAAAREFDQAFEDFRAATYADPENPSAWAGLAALSAILGEPRTAKSAYDRAIALDSSNRTTRFNYALLLARSQERDAAVAQLRSALAPGASASEQRLVAELTQEAAKSPELSPLLEDPEFHRLGQDPAR